MDHIERTAVVVEDDADIRDLLTTVLTQAGFAVTSAGTGAEGVTAAREVDPLVVTLDVSLPDIDGFEVARRIRTFSDAYVVMLTAHEDEVDVLMGLDAGADDYITKPFRPRELRARVTAMLRRPRVSGAPAAEPGDPAETTAPPEGSSTATPVAVGPRHADPDSGPVSDAPGVASHDDPEADLAPTADALVVDVDARTVTVEGTEVALTKSEFDILACLVGSAGRVVSKSELVRALWGDTYDAGTLIGPADHRSIEVHMANLRRKIGDESSSPRWIDTVRGVGYRFRVRH